MYQQYDLNREYLTVLFDPFYEWIEDHIDIYRKGKGCHTYKFELSRLNVGKLCREVKFWQILDVLFGSLLWFA